MAQRPVTEFFGEDIGLSIGGSFLGQLPRGSWTRILEVRDPQNSSRRTTAWEETYTFEGFYEQRSLRDENGIPRSTPVISVLAASVQGGVRTAYIEGGSDFSDDFSDDFGGTGRAGSRTEAVDDIPQVGDVIQMVGNPTRYRVASVNIDEAMALYECVCAV